MLLYSYSNIRQLAIGAPLQREPQDSELRWHPLRSEWAVYAHARPERTTGGGFGGCIVSLVQEVALEGWLARLAERAPCARFVP